MNRKPARSRQAGLMFALLLPGCTQVGPDFVAPEAPVAQSWSETGDGRVTSESPEDAAWWNTFDDPVLSGLIQTAYQQNPSLQLAGVRVLQARAQLGAAIGDLYPQQQQVFGELLYERLSQNAPNTSPMEELSFGVAQYGLSATWEVDFWGKFRRAIESADASLLASVASYDDALVSLTADVASTYVDIRTFEERLRIARENVEIQKATLQLAQVRYRNGETSARDVEQAKSEYAQTRAQIPQLMSGLEQARNALSVLLGMPPTDLQDVLGSGGPIPAAPPEVAIGIPADLLRRRPDIRTAEQQAAAESALIGVTEAELYPAFSLSGTFGFLSSDTQESELGDMFDWSSRVVSFGPAVVWNVFNYGQITNQVRAQDAQLQQAILSYQNTVLQAQQEVENALVSFLRTQESVALLTEGVASARRSVDLATIEYREGATDYTTVLTAQQNLLEQQDQLAVTQGDVPQSLISLYRALGGGWQIREGQGFVRADIKEVMAERTDWGGLLQPEKPLPGEQGREQPVRLPEW